MRISPHGSLSNAAKTAVNAIDKIAGRTEEIAHEVVQGIEAEAGSSSNSGIGSNLVELSLLKQQAAANVRVFETAGDLLNMPRL
ncbi:MAG: hypothetical protein CMJ48_13635 [Planctomycetaceae bacterium]|nr:hypothetical protein [Planctomycetaceae bacterium]